MIIREGDPHPNMSNPGFVYLLRPVGSTGVYKIGCTTNLERRMKTFRSYYGFAVEYVAYRHFPRYQQAEQQMHSRFSRCRLSKEWFYISNDAIEELLREWGLS